MAFDNLSYFSLFTVIICFSLLFNFCSCYWSEEMFNVSMAPVRRRDSFEHAVATWYGPADGSGSGGACGFADDVAGFPFNGMITAGNQFLYRSGTGCGSCYQVKCTGSDFCSQRPVTVTLTDECPGLCNNDPIHFDLSGIAFGAMAKPGQGASLRQLGRIDISYRRVPCYYRDTHVTFKIDIGSNPYYLAFAIEFLGGDGNIGSVQIRPNGWRQWLQMQHSWGETWKIDLSPGNTNAPFSVRIITADSKRVLFVWNVIPENWAPGQHYASHYVS